MFDSLRNWLAQRSAQVYPNYHVGNWGTPEFGVTENLANKLTSGVTQDLTNAFSGIPVTSDGQVYGENFRSPGRTLGISTENNSPQVPRVEQGPGVGQNNNASNQGNEQQLAVMKWLADLENAKRSAGSFRDNGQRTFNDLLGGIERFRGRVGEQYNAADQQITNQFSQNAGANARLGQSARTKAIQNARVGGYGDSSKLGALNQVTGNLAGMQGGLIAKRGENQTANQNLKQTRLDQAQGQEDQANTYLKGVNENAGEIERLGIQNAGFDFGSLLNNIMNYGRQLAALKAPNAEGVSAYSPNFAGLQNTLGTLTNGLAGGISGGADAASNLAFNPNNVQDLIRRRMQGQQ